MSGRADPHRLTTPLPLAVRDEPACGTGQAYPEKTETDMTRKIRLGAFLPGGGQHIASWRHPDQPADGAVSFEFHKQLAQTAERGLFDAYFLADGLATSIGGTSEGGPARVA